VQKCKNIYITEHKSIEKITATEPQLHRTVLEYFSISKNVAHCLESGETLITRRLTRLKLCTAFLNIEKLWWNNDGITINRNRSATAPEPV